MKKLVVALTVTTLALSGVVKASDAKTVARDGKDNGMIAGKAVAGAKADDACCDTKTASVTDAKAPCCCGGKMSVCSRTPSRGIAMSPKAAQLLAMR